jgi:MFS family permease
MSTIAAAYGEPASAKKRHSLAFIIAASSGGTLIEWYDFYLYGVLAGFFATHFFPGDLRQGFLYSLGIFWTGFVVRPFGAIVFGYLGDLTGRKYTFMLTLGLMGLSTFLVGCLPTYDQIGWAAPTLLVACRVVQGLALGGQYGGAATYIAEHAPDGKRGLYTSWLQTTATLGIVLALVCVMAFRLGLGDAAFSDYGWRFPFMFSALLVILSAYLRLKLGESPLYQRLKDQGKASDNPMRDTYGSGRNWALMALALFGFTAPEGVVWYTGQFYALAYMQTVLMIPYITVYVVMMVALLLGAPFFVFWGSLSDRIGRRPIMMGGFLFASLTYWPVFTWMGEFKDNPVILTLLVWYMVILVTMVYGPIAAFLVELFPARIRYSSMSLPYHIGNGVFGGGVPFIATFLAGTFTGIPLIGLVYPIGVAAIGVVVSLASLAVRQETHSTKIWDEVGGQPALVPDES